MEIWPVLVLLLLPVMQCLEPAVSAAAMAALFSAAAFVGEMAVCRVHECCNRSQWTRFNYSNLERGLMGSLMGQHAAVRILSRAITSHIENKNPRKALVLSLHGCTGCGKNFASDLVVSHLYKHGTHSQFVHKLITSEDFVHKRDYDNKLKLDSYKEKIKDLIMKSTRACQQSLFVFDEVDKMPDGVMDILMPFLGSFPEVEGLDYRKNIFIFLGNTPGDTISHEIDSQLIRGVKREEIDITGLEDNLRKLVMELRHSMRNSALIEANLIDFYVPFLPLERRHVVQCALAEMSRRGKESNQTLAELAASQLAYTGPMNFSTTGCKLVAKKLDMFM